MNFCFSSQFGSRVLLPWVAGAAILIFSTQASATLVNVGVDAFSGSSTVLDFEDTIGNAVNLTPGYGSSSGVTFTATTRSYAYSGYGTTLTTNAATAGLGDRAATWGGTGAYGTGFSLTDAQTLVGMYISSNVRISTTVSAFLGGSLLGSQLVTVAGNEIGFVGFEDFSGIDRIAIGSNTLCPSCIHQLDNVMFESGDGSTVPVPATLALFGLGLAGLGWSRRKKG
jgi:hypothetical protein